MSTAMAVGLLLTAHATIASDAENPTAGTTVFDLAKLSICGECDRGTPGIKAVQTNLQNGSLPTNSLCATRAGKACTDKHESGATPSAGTHIEHHDSSDGHHPDETGSTPTTNSTSGSSDQKGHALDHANA